MFLDWSSCSRESTQDPHRQEQCFSMISWKWVAKAHSDEYTMQMYENA